MEHPESTGFPLVYAGFWRRFAAYWLDVVVWLPVLPLIFYLQAHYKHFQASYLVPGTLVGFWFGAYLVYRYGGTPGKLIMGIRIRMEGGEPVTFRAACARYAVLMVLSFLSSLASVIAIEGIPDDAYATLNHMERMKRIMEGAPWWNSIVGIAMQIWVWGEFLTMMANKRRRAVHDFIAGTVVVRKIRDPSPEAPGTPVVAG